MLRIGEKTYLEFLAKDNLAEPVHTQTWMGLDLLQSDKVTRWSLATQDVEHDAGFLKKYDEHLAPVEIGSRASTDGTMLNWLMTNVLPSPEVEAAPFLLDWKKSTHPTVGLPLQCSIKSFTIEHPESELLKKLLEKLECPIDVYTANETSLKLILDTPKGDITL